MINSKDPIIGYDSLLDTMTNVVGILIIVLAVSYLTVRDTVNRIVKLDQTSTVNDLEYQQLQTNSKRLDKVLEQVREEWKTAHKDARSNNTQLDQIQNKTGNLTNLLKQNNLSRINIQETSQEILRDRRKLQQLEEEVDLLKQQFKQVQYAINLQRDLPKPKVTIARVPDPVPAPEGAKRISFLCRYGRVVYYPADKMIQILHQGIANATGSELSNPRIKISEFKKVKNYFDTHKITLGGLRWRLNVIQRRDAANVTHRDLKAYLEWTTPDVGETLEGIRENMSQYSKILSESAGKPVYAKYYVWGDSFPEYAVAREIADEKKIPAGWVAKEGDAEYILAIASTITGKKRESPGKIRQMPMKRVYLGSGSGIGVGGGGTSYAPASGGGSVGIIGSSPGGDFVD